MFWSGAQADTSNAVKAANRHTFARSGLQIPESDRAREIESSAAQETFYYLLRNYLKFEKGDQGSALHLYFFGIAPQ